MGRRRTVAVVALLLVVSTLAACAPGQNTAAGADPATDVGFLLGLWHGFICPITFVVSLFTESVGIYEINNNGGWYDLGFLLGASVALGGGARGARRR